MGNIVILSLPHGTSAYQRLSSLHPLYCSLLPYTPCLILSLGFAVGNRSLPQNSSPELELP
jgi:hypothetical protein